MAERRECKVEWKGKEKEIMPWEGRVTLVSGLVLVLLLVAFVFMTILNTYRLMEQLEQISEHPFRVLDSASILQNDLERIQVYTERLQYNNDPDMVAEVREQIETIYLEVEEHLQIVEERYLGEHSEVAALREQLERLKTANEQLFQYAAAEERSESEIVAFTQQEITSSQAEMEEILSGIMDYARDRFDYYYSAAGDIRTEGTIFVILITAAVVAVLNFYRTRIRRQTREILRQNRLFDLLGRTVDTVFFISSPRSGREDYISPNAERILGVPVEQLMKDPYVLRPYITEKERESIAAALKDGGESCWKSTVCYRHPHTGEDRDLLIQVYRVSGGGKEDEPQYITVFTDETQLLRTQRELEEATARAEQASRAKSEFLSRMSHEIRTPMNGIIGMTLIALQKSDDREKVVECLRKISMSSKHLLVLINDVLDMSKIESGKLELKREPFDLRRLLEGVSDLAYGQAAQREITFGMQLVGDMDEQLIGDSLRVNQILMNLLSNALKFTPRGGKVALRVELLESNVQTQQIRFEVQDTGCGIAEENFGKIFETFEQESAGVAHQYGGTGLGLAICKRFVEMMGGRIGLSSTLGKGSTFFVHIPFQRVESAGTPPREEYRQLRALVADDDLESCEHIALLLRKLGARCDWVDNGYEALARVERARDESDPYGLVLVDWKMPFLDGVETARRLHGEAPETAVVLITAFDEDEVREKAKNVGARDVLNKPVFESALVDLLDRLWSERGAFPAREEGPADYDFRDKCILIVEDNDLNREIAVELLGPSGARLETACDGQEAVERFAASRPGHYDLILMDVQMPRMDGYAATRAIRAMERPDGKRIPILAMTANAFSEDVEKSREAGMNGHISKPINLAEVYRTLSAALGGGM